MKVTIRDIARKRAFLRQPTVSNVFNGKNKISQKTRDLVLSIARERGYAVPTGISPENRSLRFIIFKRHGKVIMDTPFFSELIGSIETTCRSHQYELLITYMDGNDPNMPNQVAEILKNGNRGILLLATEMTDDQMRLFQNCKVPLLVLDSLFLWDAHNAVIINNREAGFLAAEHFIDCGHRRFGLITSSFAFKNMEDRRDGYIAGLARHGYKLDERDILYVEPTMEGAAHDMLALLDERYRAEPLAHGGFRLQRHHRHGRQPRAQTTRLCPARRCFHHRHGRRARVQRHQPATDHVGRESEPIGRNGRQPPAGND